MSSNGDSERRIQKYKEERRRQLASQIASKLNAASSSSGDEETEGNEKQIKPYSKYKRKRKKDEAENATCQEQPTKYVEDTFSRKHNDQTHKQRLRSPTQRVFNDIYRPQTEAKTANCLTRQKSDNKINENNHTLDFEKAQQKTVPDASFLNRNAQLVSESCNVKSLASTKPKSLLKTGAVSYSSDEVLIKAANELRKLDVAANSSEGIKSTSNDEPVATGTPKRLNGDLGVNAQCSNLCSESNERKSTFSSENISYDSPVTSPGSIGNPPLFPKAEAPCGNSNNKSPSRIQNASSKCLEESVLLPNPKPDLNLVNSTDTQYSLMSTAKSKMKNSSTCRRKSDFNARFEDLERRASALSMENDADDSSLSPEPIEMIKKESAFPEAIESSGSKSLRSKRRKSLGETSSQHNNPSSSNISWGSPISSSSRLRSSSLTFLDDRPCKKVDSIDRIENEEIMPKPILKKSTDDLNVGSIHSKLKPVPILKYKEQDLSMGSDARKKQISKQSHRASKGILKKRSVEGQRPDHIRIRTPSPDETTFPRPILRSRNNSTCDERVSSPEPHSILKRRSSFDDHVLGWAPMEPQGILKRKHSSAGTSGTHTPESLDGNGSRPLCSILKKQSSLEDVEQCEEQIKPILKRNTDDELEESPASEKPKSILKRKSEDNLSALEDNQGKCAISSRTSIMQASFFDQTGKPKPILKRKASQDKKLTRSRTLSPSHDDVEISVAPTLRYRSSSHGRRPLLTTEERNGSCSDFELVDAERSQRFAALKASWFHRTTESANEKEVEEKSNDSRSQDEDNLDYTANSRNLNGGSKPVKQGDELLQKPERSHEEDKRPLASKGSIVSSESQVERNAQLFEIDKTKPSPDSYNGFTLPRKRSVLKHESFDSSFSKLKHGNTAPVRRVLRRNSSDEETLKPILKNPDDTNPLESLASKIPATPSSSSNEDVSLKNAPFSDVIIDPIPDSFKEPTNGNHSNIESISSSTKQSPLKRTKQTFSGRRLSLTNRKPVIEPSSVNISSDDRDLADKLEEIAQKAEAIKRQQQKLHPKNEELILSDSEDGKREANCAQNSRASVVDYEATVTTSSSRKKNEDLGADHQYHIFENQCQRKSNSSETNGELLSSLRPKIHDHNLEKEASRKGLDLSVESTEIADNKIMDSGTKLRSNGIAERLAALQKSGEENWKKKVPKLNPENPVLDILNSNVLESDSENSEIVQLRRNRVSNPKRPVSIVDRLGKLEVAQQSWTQRVGEKDVNKFTVAGKMEKDQKKTAVLSGMKMLSPETISQAGRPTRPRTPTNEGGDENCEESGDQVKLRPKPRIIIGETVNTPIRPMSTPVQSSEKSSSECNIREGKTVTVPRLDSDDVDKFFSSFSNSARPSSEASENYNFDEIIPDTTMLVMPKRTSLAKQNRRKSRNPVKKLAERKDLKDEYTEFVSDMAMNSTNGKRPDTSSKHAHLAAEALAGLASKEDFSSVQLRKSQNVQHIQELIPYQELMLLQVKGRRVCQTRLVEPKYTSINSGDAYVLVTPKEIFNWQGKFANVIEKSRSAEIALMIFQRKDLGCKLARNVQTIDEEKSFGSSRPERAFWTLLGTGGEPKPKPPGPPDEDEIFEAKINELNMIWEVNLDNGKEELVPLQDFWGSVVRHDALDPNKVLVIDFGSEAYVWNGKSATNLLRRAGINLAKKVWDDGFDYSGAHGTNPLLGTEQLNGPRPKWGLLGKVTQHMETILFREKFADWPDEAKVIRVKEDEEKMATAVLTCSGEIDVEPFDAREMVQWTVNDPNLVLEMSCLGRGRGFYDEVERRLYEVETVSLKCWYVQEYEIKPLEDNWNAQFHNHDAYVFRWIYKVSLTARDLKGNPSKHAAVGRERCVYFFWQGSKSKVTEKGTSALMTVELDAEKGPQVKVEQGREDAAFLNLWQGLMTVHNGKRGNRANKSHRLFVVRGETEEEAFAVEVPCKFSSLRSLACFVLTEFSSNEIKIWHGSSAPEHTKKVAKAYAKNIAERKPKEMGFDSCGVIEIKEEVEGDESENFRRALDSESGEYIANFSPPPKSPRLFRMSAVSGEFIVSEVLCPFRKKDVPNLMAFNQNNLYNVEQPGLFFLDAGSSLWLWQGWWPQNLEESDSNNITGSGMIRWHAERRAAMQTIVDYRRIVYGHLREKPKTELVWAGCEPTEFINLFPTWISRYDVGVANRQYVKDTSLDLTLYQLSKSEYSWEELQQRPLPDGVDPTKLEKYLTDSDFEKHLGISKTVFMAHPRWKQIEIRKEKGLF